MFLVFLIPGALGKSEILTRLARFLAWAADTKTKGAEPRRPFYDPRNPDADIREVNDCSTKTAQLLPDDFWRDEDQKFPLVVDYSVTPEHETYTR